MKKELLTLEMEGKSSPIFAARRGRKSGVLPFLSVKESQDGVESISLHSDVDIMRRKSVNTPPTWQSSAKGEKNTKSLLSTDKPPRKYSENLHTLGKNYWPNRMDGNLGFQTGIQGVCNRRSMSLVHNDGKGMLLGEEVLLRPEELYHDQLPVKAASFGIKHSLDEITWSRYWHDARNRTNVRDRLLTNVPTEKPQEDKLISNTVDLSNDGDEPKNGKNEHDDAEPSVHVDQLSLEERLEKIERDSGLTQNQDDKKRKMLFRKNSAIY